MIAGLIISAALGVGAEPPGMSETRRDALAKYGAAVWNLHRDRLLSAAKQLEAVVKADPEATEPQKELAKLYVQLGREPQAIRLARKVLDKDPVDYETAVLLARLLFDAGETKEAIAVAKLAVENESIPNKPAKAVRIYREVAMLSEKAGDFATAETALSKAIELVFDNRAAVVAGLAFTPKEADTEAAECFERLGHILVKRAKFDLAAEAFTSAAKLYRDPKKLNDWRSAARLAWNLSGALEAKGDHADALKQLEQYLKLQPRSPEPYQRLAKLLRAVGRSDEVVSMLEGYAKRDGGNRPLAALVAVEMARDIDTRRGADELFATITAETADPVVIAIVVRSHLNTNRPIEIIKDLDRAFVVLEKDKEKEKKESPETIAAKKKFAGEKARAIADALEKEPKGVADILFAASEDMKAGNKRAHGTYYFLGSLAVRHGQVVHARQQFQQAVLGAPKELHVEAYSSYIRALWLEGKPAEVERVCLKAIQDSKELGNVNVADVFFQFHLSLALAEQGKAEAAIKAANTTILQAGASDRLAVRLRKHHVLRSLGQWDDAIDYGKQLLEEFDTPEERSLVRYAQASAYWGAKKPLEAEKLLRAILDDDPDNAGACNDLGYHLADQGRNLDEAERLIRHALAVDHIERRKSGSAEPDNAAYIDSLGWVLFRQGKLAEAKIELEKAAKLAGGASDAAVWDHLGDVLFRLNDKAKAKAAWEKAKELYEADARLSSRGRLDEVKRKLLRVP